MNKTLLKKIQSCSSTDILQISRQQAVALLGKGGLAEVIFNLETGLKWGGKVKYDPYSRNYFIRTYGCRP